MRKSHYLLALLPGLVVVPAQAQSVRVEEHGRGPGGGIDQAVIFSQAKGRWIAERSLSSRHFCAVRPGSDCKGMVDERSHDWIDGNACPQLLGVLSALADVPPPHFSKPSNDAWVVDDGSLLTIEGYPAASGGLSGYGGEERLSVRQYGGPFRTWWDASAKRIGACWKPDAPMLDGKPAAPQLPAMP